MDPGPGPDPGGEDGPDGGAGRAAGWDPACGAGWWPAGCAGREVRAGAGYQEWVVASGLPAPTAARRLLDAYLDGAGP